MTRQLSPPTGRLLSPALCGLLMLVAGSVEGTTWPRADIRALPDEAFAAIEVRPDGRRARHLPHHDASGRLDLGHLKNALARFCQVRWQDPETAEFAWEHLLKHRGTERPRAGGSHRAHGDPPPCLRPSPREPR